MSAQTPCATLDIQDFETVVDLLRCYLALGRFAVVDKLYGALSEDVVVQALYELLRDVASIARGAKEEDTYYDEGLSRPAGKKLVVAEGSDKVKNVRYAYYVNRGTGGKKKPVVVAAFATFDPRRRRNIEQSIEDLLKQLNRRECRQKTLLLVRKLAAKALTPLR